MSDHLRWRCSEVTAHIALPASVTRWSRLEREWYALDARRSALLAVLSVEEHRGLEESRRAQKAH